MSKIRLQQRRAAQKKHGKAGALNLVSLMDIFTILVFFLMVNSSEVEVLQTSSKIKLPDSTSEQRPENQLVISISQDDLVLQGRPVARVDEIIARRKELEILEKMLTSRSAELVAIYGRRRIGKTYLIRSFSEAQQDVVYFELMGQKQESGEYASLKIQLANFKYQFERSFKREIVQPTSWQEAFTILRKETERYKNSKVKLILFFDELDSIAQKRGGHAHDAGELSTAWTKHTAMTYTHSSSFL